MEIEFLALDTRDGKIYRPTEFGDVEINDDNYCINFNGDICIEYDDGWEKVDNIKLMMAIISK